VNRSVISGTVAAAVLCAGSGIVAAPTAVAQPAQPVAGNEAAPGGAEADAAPGGAGATARAPRPPGRSGKPSDGGAAREVPTAGWIPLWPCHWPVVPPAPRPDTEPEGSSGGGIAVGPVTVPPVVPQAQISGGVQRAASSLIELPLIDAAPIEAAPPEASPAQLAPLPAVPAPVPAPFLAPVQSPPPPVAVPPNPVGPAAPAASAPPPRRSPVAVAGPTVAPPSLHRVGYPDALRNADAAALATNALPGLAVILGMTMVGGLIGYRQAKAGSVLRAAGAARFLQ
jgi:hypothetical protein